MNRRTLTLLVVAVAVIGGVYAITLWQRSRETHRLMEELQSPDHAAAAQAMMSLRERAPSVREQLIQIAGQEAGHVRWRAVTLLGEVEGQASRDVLLNALQARDPIVRAAAITALAQRDVRAAGDRIAMFATDQEEPMQVRLAAVRAIQRLRTGAHFAEMARLATDRPPPPPEPEEEPAEDAVEEPAEAISEEPVEAAEAAAEAPAEEAAEEVAVAAAEAPAEEAEEWSDDTIELRIEAVRAVAILGAAARQHVGDAAESPAETAAEVLAEACGPEEHNATVRQAACYAMTDLASLDDSAEVRARAVQVLLRAVADEVGSVRVAAIHGLSTVRVPAELRDQVQRAMNEALNDDHYWVRVAAGEEPIGG
ncbi:MAG: HEAT repeat domain-containing protein [Armatimonadota bacterium]